MERDIKEPILIIVLAIVIAVTAGLFLLKKSSVNTRILAEERLFQEKILKKKTDEKLSRAEKDRDGLKESVARLMQKVESLESELAADKRDIAASEKRIADIDDTVFSKSQEISSLDSNIKEFRSRIANIVKDRFKLDQELTLVKNTRDALKRRLFQYAKKIPPKVKSYYADVPATELSEAQGPIAQSALVGEILTVNREFDFVVMNLGRNDDIAEGMFFRVSRDNKGLGEVVVETVRDNISAAAVTDKESLVPIKPGDKVHYLY